MQGRRWIGAAVMMLVGCGAEAPAARQAVGGDPGATSSAEASAAPPRAASAAPKTPVAPRPVSSSRRKLVRVEIESDLGRGTLRTTHVYRYDTNGRLTREEVSFDGNEPHSVTTYQYDAGGLLIGIHADRGHGLGSRDELAYDAAGRLTKSCHFQEVGILAVMPRNRCSELSYDAKGRVIESRSITFDRSEVPAGGVPERVTRYERVEDAAGRVTEEHTVEDGRRISSKLSRFDVEGRLTTEIVDMPNTPAIEELTRFEYDKNGQLVRRVRTRAGSFDAGVATFEYEGGELARASGDLPEEATRGHNSARATYSYSE